METNGTATPFAACQAGNRESEVLTRRGRYSPICKKYGQPPKRNPDRSPKGNGQWLHLPRSRQPGPNRHKTALPNGRASTHSSSPRL